MLSLLLELVKYPPNQDFILQGGNGLAIVIAATRKYHSQLGLKTLWRLSEKDRTITTTLLTDLGGLLVNCFTFDVVDPEICSVICGCIEVRKFV